MASNTLFAAFQLFSFTTSVLAAGPDLVARSWNGTKYGCKCYIGDACWPTSSDWSSLNKTLDGNLYPVTPPGAVCHQTFSSPIGSFKTYDVAACEEATAKFGNEQWNIDHAAAALWPYFTNETCRPTSDPKEPCTLGNYPIYVITAKKHDHIKVGIDFAREKNLRLVIRNTGHDFLGRSTGWGSLVINTHSFQENNFTASYSGPGNYQGPAVTIGAGTQARDFLKLCHAQKPPMVVVTGECPTVGIAGGLVQGGGHGPWTPLKGFTADNALGFQVLTANGTYATANAAENPDLYWALKGGGPGAYAVILSTTFATFPDLPSSGMTLNINGAHTTNETLLWAGIKAFHSYANRFVDAGLYVYYEIVPGSLHVQPFLAINQTAAQLSTAVKPLLLDLDKLGLKYNVTAAKDYPTFYDLYLDLFEDETAGQTALTGGWTFAKQDVASNNDEIVDAFHNVLKNGAIIVGHMWQYGKGITDSAVNPRFRNSTNKVIAAMPVSATASLIEKDKAQKTLTFVVDEGLRKAGPNGCAYVNEADPFQPNWQENFWGANYKKLYEIRKKWDPSGVFYAVSTPGTEDWEQIEYGTRLCKKL